MAKAILILNRPMLEEVYRANFKNFLDMDLECYPVVDDAIEALNNLKLPAKRADYKLILIMPDSEPAQALEKLLASGLTIVCLGHTEMIKTYPQVTFIENPYELKNVLAPVARLMGITAKDMANKEVPDLVAIPLKLLTGLMLAPCDLFLNYQEGKKQSKEDFSLFLRKDDRVENKIQKQMNTGLKNIYVPKDMRLQIINAANQSLLTVLKNEQAPIEQKLEGLDKGLHLLSEYIGMKELQADKIQELGHLCVTEMQVMVKKIPKLRELIILLLQNKASYTFTHSILSSYIADGIIREMPWGAKGQAEKLSYAFFFHDIFLTPIINRHPGITSEEEMIFGEMLSEKEKEVVLKHASLAHDLVVALPHTPVGAETIILQHHGTRGGVDFTSDFADYLAPLSKVAIIAHAAAEIILENKKTNNSDEIETKLIVNELKDRFRRPTYLKIIESLEKVKGF
jgi:hypothetical protein